MTSRRVKLGRDFSFSERVYAFLTAGAVEVDHVDGYNVTTRRVLLDEVQLVTLHRTRRAAVIVACVLGWLMFAWPLLILPKREASAAVAFLVLSSPFAILLLLHLMLGTDYLTVFGRRSKARLAFNYRKGRAREVFDLLVREVSAAQAARAPAAAPAAAPAEAAPAEGPATGVA